MRSTNAPTPLDRKQTRVPDSLVETERRFNAIQSDLAAIAYAMGDARKMLTNRDRFFNACRDPKKAEPFRPYVIEDEMLVDVARTTAEHGTMDEQCAVRNAVVQYFATRCRLALEFLGEPCADDVATLAVATTKEIAEAQCATLTALSTKSPEALERAGRETGEAETFLDQLEKSLYITARRVRSGTGAKLSVLR